MSKSVFVIYDTVDRSTKPRLDGLALALPRMRGILSTQHGVGSSILMTNKDM